MHKTFIQNQDQILHRADSVAHSTIKFPIQKSRHLFPNTSNFKNLCFIYLIHKNNQMDSQLTHTNTQFTL